MTRARRTEQALCSLQHGIRARSRRLVDEEHPADRRLSISHGGSIRFLAGDCRVDQLREMHASLDREVVHKADFRGDAESQALSELDAQESGRVLEPRFYPGQ